jgi:hypothetical protein
MGGKFICPDPLGFLDGDNLYAYAHNDPLTWHDPDGEFAHILIGGGVGAALGGGAYAFQVWATGEEFSWTKFGIYTFAGGASGAIAAATFGAASPALVNVWGGSFLANGAAGAAGGATRGAIASGLVAGVVEQRGVADSLLAAGKGALVEGTIGGLGGPVGGTVLSRLPLNVPGSVRSVLAGAAGGASSGAVVGGIEGYEDTGTLAGTLRGATRGGGRGAALGAGLGAAFYGVGWASGKWLPLPKQPPGISDPRTRGTLVRTPRPENLTYGEVETQPGFNRHHVKPLSLGGSDTPDNIRMIPMEIHRLPHPGPSVNQAEPGTIFY